MDPALPTEAQMAAMDALSQRFATALLDEGRRLSGPNPDYMARMLVFVTAGRVLAKLGMDAAAAGAGIEQAIVLAKRHAIIEEGRKIALAAKAGDR